METDYKMEICQEKKKTKGEIDDKESNTEEC
jgi:hypothetical protein